MPNTNDFAITFTVAQPADTTPPVRTNGAPSGTLAAGTTQTTLSLGTDENATCRYATTAGVAYGSMPNTFTTTGGTAHATTVTGLVNGGSYNYYVRCQDTAGNAEHQRFRDRVHGGAAGRHDATGALQRGAERSAGGRNHPGDPESQHQRECDLPVCDDGRGGVRVDAEHLHHHRRDRACDDGDGVGERRQLQLLRPLPGHGRQSEHQ